MNDSLKVESFRKMSAGHQFLASRGLPRAHHPARTMLFCPQCGTLLLTEMRDGFLHMRCSCCPYIHELEETFSRKVPLKKKSDKVDDVLGGDKAWEKVDQTEALCPHCGNGKAYFMQLQTRSADEPMTIFYKCTKCKKRWKE